MKTPKYLILKNSHLKIMKIVHEEKVTTSDKKLIFQSKMIVCESLQRYEQVIVNS